MKNLFTWKLINLSDVQQNAATVWNYDENGEDWQGTCANGQRQAPIKLSVDSVSRTNRNKPTNSLPIMKVHVI